MRDRLHGIIVEYPEDKEERVTLGTRVTINNGERESQLDIIGFAAIHDKKSNSATPASLEAPIIRGILGKIAGEMAVMSLGSRSREIAIVKIDQQALRLKDEGTRDS